MELERLVAALAPEAVLGSPDPVEVRDLAYDTRAVTPGAAFFCVPGEHADGHDFAARGGRERRRRARRRAGASSREVPQLVVPSSRAAMATAADVFFGEPTRELEVAGVTGTNGKTTTAYLLHAILDGRRPPPRPARHRREPDRRRGAAGRAHDARGDRPAADVPRDARRRRPQRRARGVLARLGAAPARPRPLRRARLHEPDARITSTSTGRWRSTSRRSGGSSPARRRRPRRSTSATRGGGSSPTSSSRRAARR